MSEYDHSERPQDDLPPRAKGSPAMAAVGPARPQPRRLRKHVVVGVMAVVAGVAILAFSLAILREPEQLAAAVEQPVVGTESTLPSFVKNAPKNYGEIPQPPPPAAEPAAPLLGPPLEGDLGHVGVIAEAPFLPPRQAQPPLTPQEQREREDYLNALTSPLLIDLPLASIRNRAAGGAEVTRTAAPPPAQMEALSRLAGGGERVGGGPQDEKRAFLQSAQDRDDPFYVKGRLQAPLSPYELKAGAIIPCALITGINADLPGSLTCQVRENVFDTVTGQHLLVPQGTRVVGEYDSAIIFGQNRVLVVWHRLILPDGASISLEGMQGVDLSGYAGFADRVDHHWQRLIGAVILSSIFAAAPVATVGDDSGEFNRNINSEVARNIGDNIQRAGDQIVSKNLNIQPTITIRPGYAVNIFVKKDLVLAPYTYQRRIEFAVSGATDPFRPGKQR